MLPAAFLVVVLGFLLLLPVFTIAAFVLVPNWTLWSFLWETRLPEYLGNSFWLLLGVTVGSVSLGVGCAWAVSAYRFPGQRWLQWLLLLPMAIPAYILAYTYTGMLDFAGPVQSTFRAWTGLGYGEYFFPNVRSLPGAILMFSLVLYPYVYLFARAAFRVQSPRLHEAALSLGARGLHLWWLRLSVARPAIIAGLTLVLMETLADFGTVEYFGVATFTTGIFRTWFGLKDWASAAQLSAILLFFLFLLILIERASRRQAQYYLQGQGGGRLARQKVAGVAGWLLTLLCFLPVLLAVVLPVSQLLQWAWWYREAVWSTEFLLLLRNSLLLALALALLALALAWFLAFVNRRQVHKPWWLLMGFSALRLGYALPGMVIAFGVFIPLALLEQQLHESIGILFTGTLFALVFAYLVRFLPVALSSMDAGFAQVTPNIDAAARSLSASGWRLWWQVHVPMLRLSMLTAVLLVFVDVLKELPATLILRPFNFNTLAVRAYELASDERLTEAALPALAIVAIGILPVVLLITLLAREERS
jgi:iron(III) transport system permease protein